MFRLTRVIAPALAVAALVPAVGQAAQDGAIRLGGNPTIQKADATSATLRFVVQRQLPTSGVTVRVGGTRTGALRADGRHGKGFRYTSRLVKTMQVGRTVTVRFSIRGQQDIVAYAKVRAAK